MRPFVPSESESDSPPFDSWGFYNDMKKYGRAYRHRSIELICLCRFFSRALNDFPGQYFKLQVVLNICDAAIAEASQRKGGPNTDLDGRFAEAICALRDYDEILFRGLEVERRMWTAKVKDTKTPWWNILANSRRVLSRSHAESPQQAENDRLRVIEFHILRSLTEPRPYAIALQAIKGRPSIPEILWNFSHYTDERRLTLTQNPFFYEDLPRNQPLSSKYKDKVHDPIAPHHGKVYVLTNDLKHVFIHKAPNWRAFDNVLDVYNALLLKDIFGRLESETTIGRYIPYGITYHLGRPPQVATGDTLEAHHWKVPVEGQHLFSRDNYVCITCRISESENGLVRSCPCEAP